MPRFEITAPDGRKFEITAPEGATQDEVLAYAQANYSAIPAAKPAPFSLADTGLAALQSALGATKSTIEGVTGAGSAPGEYLEGLQKILGEKLSPERKAEIQRRIALEKQAAETGKPLEEIAAGLGGVKEAPVQTFAQAVGSSAPTVLLGVGAAALGATLGAPAAIAAGVGIAAKYLLGAVQGAGEVKGTIYDTVKDKLMDNNVPEAEAKRQATAAQDYLGKNWDTIAQGLGLGAIAGGTGVETELLKKFSRPVAKQIAAKEAAKVAEQSTVKEFGKAIGKEALTEGLQGGQQQYAENVALTREGYLTNAMKGVYGAAARDAAMGAIGGGGIHALAGRPAPEARPTPEVKPELGPQIAPEAPVGTQGALFTEEEMGKRVPTPKEEPIPKVMTPAAQGEQLDLGLEFQRDYADIIKERERLKALPQTSEVKARITELNDMALGLHEQEVAAIRAEKQVDAETRGMFPGLSEEPAQQGLFPELDVVRPEPAESIQPKALTLKQEEARRRLQETQDQEAATAAQKEQERKGGQYRLPLRTVPEDRNVRRDLPIPARPDEITMQDLEDLGLPMRSAKTWLEQNVVGKTPAEIRVLVGNNPDLLLQKGTRAQVLKYLTAPVPEGFKEETRVTTPAKTNKPEPRPQPRGGKPSVGVSGQPAIPNVVQPGAGVSTAAGAPTTPDGLGLAPAGQPAGEGAAAEGKAKPTLETKEERRARLRAEKAEREERTSHEVSIDGKPVELEIIRDKTKPLYKGNYPVVELRIKGLHKQPITMPFQGYETDAEVIAFLRENDSIDDTPSAAAPAIPAAKPAVAAKPTPKAAPAKATEAPAPAVAAETADEEAARKAEAEDVKRRLEEVERKLQARPAPKAAPAPAPKAEKPEPKEIPEKLREPIGTSEYGMEEGEKEIQRGPQGMLFPMSKREELEYAEQKQREATKPEEEALATKDERQAELDLQERKEIPEKVQKVADKLKGTVEYYGPNGAIIRTYADRTGNSIYIPVSTKADYFTAGIFGGALGIKAIRGDVSKVFTQKDFDALKAEVVKLEQQDAADAAKYPDGPFTGAKTNVVAGDSIDKRYTNYLTDLMKSLGLGDVRVFLYHGKDVKGRGDELHLHGDYYPILARAEPDKGQDGATRSIGPTGKDFMLFVNDNMSEERTLEVISHELGHMIKEISYDNAPANVKTAIKNEYGDWVDSLKGKKKSDLIASLRNRYTTEQMEREGISDVDLSKMTAKDLSYWMGFDEWFADNVSRWATTADKPLTITEKFFSKVAQMMRDLVALVTGRKFPPNKKVAEFLEAMGPGSADMWLAAANKSGATSVKPLQNALSTNYTAQDVVNSMGPLTPTNERGLKGMIVGAQKEGDPSRGVKFRVAAADSAAAIEEKLSRTFNGAVRDSLGKINPMGLYRQAQDYSKLLLEYFQNGALVKEKTTGLYRAVGTGNGAPADVFPLIYAWGKKTGRTNKEAEQFASRVLEAKRLDEVLKINPDFPKHINDRDRALLVAEYNADPDFAKMSAAMDKPRLALIDQMVAVGRLSKEKADEWKSVIGYVPFDRIDDFSEKFSAVKRTTGRAPLALTKDPELVGSFTRPVGNVFENYLNTMGWMVGQVIKNDARVQTLRSLQELGFAGKPSPAKGTESKSAKAFVDGELRYWDLPSEYDAAAFQDLNPPKMAIMRTLGAFSNILRKSVTILPPFALKQVTDDVQRAMLTSGVKNPGALLRMSLANFGKLAVAELRGIQHPIVKEFGALGLTGEYDFEQGKPAVSLLKDLGYRERGRFETILHRLDGITRASDLAVRKAIYDQTLEENNKDMLLAQTRAREFINFRRRGASEIVAVATATIPFFNAYVQGMDVLYRAASGKDSSSSVGRAQARQLFWSRAWTVVGLSAMYALTAGNDDDYKDMDLRTRNGNWILPGGAKIPVPGELGAIFKVIPETVIEYLRRSGTPEEQTALEAIRAAAKYMSEQYIERTVPIPQAVKPLIEAWTNYSFFTGRELEGIYQKQQDPSMRTTSKTSELAQAISNFSRDVVGVDAVSPIQIDNMLNGYFGSTAALVTMTTDSLLNPTRVDRPLHKYALLSNYLYDPVGTRSLTEFYDERENVGKANNTLRQLMKTDIARAETYANAHQSELAMESAINSTLEQLERTRAYRKFLNSPDGAASMDKDKREKELEEIKKMEIEFTRWMREAKTELRKVQ
jgi:hypothetical protein